MTEFPIIEKLGGREAVLKIVKAWEEPRRGHESKRPMTRFTNWKERGMPARARLALELAAREQGIEYGPEDFELSDSDERPAA